MAKTHRFNYEKYIKDLVEFMDKNGLKLKPFPKIHISNKKQDGVFIKTAYYDPQTKEVYVFVNQRHSKDVLRSIAHELCHHNQNLEGRLVGYKGDTLGQDDHLDKLEAEAYLKGNILFRMWTETKTKSEKPEKTFSKHMKKKISFNENKLRPLIKKALFEILNEEENNQKLDIESKIKDIATKWFENYKNDLEEEFPQNNVRNIDEAIKESEKIIDSFEEYPNYVSLVGESAVTLFVSDENEQALMYSHKQKIGEYIAEYIKYYIAEQKKLSIITQKQELERDDEFFF